MFVSECVRLGVRVRFDWKMLMWWKSGVKWGANEQQKKRENGVKQREQ